MRLADLSLLAAVVEDAEDSTGAAQRRQGFLHLSSYMTNVTKGREPCEDWLEQGRMTEK